MVKQIQAAPENFNSLIETVEYFKDEQTCIKYFQEQRWGENITCPHCNHHKVYKFSDGRRFKCASCREQFNVRTGSIFEDSKIPLKKWFIASYLVLNHKKGISSYQLAKDINVTQKTAWFMLHRIRHVIGEDNNNEVKLGGNSIVEIDETFVGGKNKNRHKNKKVQNSQGRSFKDKTPVLGMVERGGKLKTKVIKDTKRRAVQPVVVRSIKLGSTIMTDEWIAYRQLYKVYQHSFVNHGAGQYVDGQAHTNTIEGYWSWFKRTILGTHHQLPAKHLQAYSDESTFRYNTRKMSENNRISLMLQTVNGKLSYKTLIADASK